MPSAPAKCDICRKRPMAARCSGCFGIGNCSVACQRASWSMHQQNCALMATLMGRIVSGRPAGPDERLFEAPCEMCETLTTRGCARCIHNLLHKATFTPLPTAATSAGGTDDAADYSVLDALLQYCATSGARALIDVGALTAGRQRGMSRPPSRLACRRQPSVASSSLTPPPPAGRCRSWTRATWMPARAPPPTRSSSSTRAGATVPA